MTYKIEMIVKGGNELKNDLEKGYIELGMSTDVFEDEEVLEFRFAPVEPEPVFSPKTINH